MIDFILEESPQQIDPLPQKKNGLALPLPRPPRGRVRKNLGHAAESRHQPRQAPRRERPDPPHPVVQPAGVDDRLEAIARVIGGLEPERGCPLGPPARAQL